MVPKLRFKEFCGEWEETELKNEVDIINPKIKVINFNIVYFENMFLNIGVDASIPIIKSDMLGIK